MILEEIKKLNQEEVSVPDVSDLQNKIEALQLSIEQKNELEDRIFDLEKVKIK